MAWTKQELEQAKGITSQVQQTSRTAGSREQFQAKREAAKSNPASVFAKPKSEGFGSFLDKVGEFGSQAGRTILKTGETISGLGQKTLGRVVGAYKPGQEVAKLPAELTREAKTPAEEAGAVFGEAAQLMTPVGGESAVAKGVTILDKVLANSPKLASLAKMGVKSLVGGAEFAGKAAAMGESKEDIKSQGIIGAVTPPVLKVAGSAVKGLFSKALPEVLGMTTGIHPDALKAAFRNPGEMAKLMSSNVVPEKVREQAISALSKFEGGVKKTFGEGISKLSKVVPESVSNFKNKITESKNALPEFFKEFNIAVKDGKLDFDKLNSSVVSPTEQANIQKVWDTFKGQTDFSASGAQAIASRLEALSKYSDGVATRKSALIGKVKSEFKNAIKEVYPELHGLRSEYGVKSQMIKGMREVLSPGKNAVENPTKIVSIVKRLTDIFHQDKEAYVKVLKDLENETGVDLILPLAASEFRGLIPKGGVGKLGQASVLTGAYFSSNPWTLLIAPLFSPSFVGKAVTTAGKVSEVAGKVAPYLPKAEKVIPTLTGLNK